MKKLFILAILVIGGLYVSGCYYDRFNELHPLDGYVNTCDPKLENTYTATANVIIRYNCISCHNSSQAQGGLVFESLSQVKKAVNDGSFMGAVRHESDYKSMPPNTKLRDCDIEKLQLWIDAGMPE